MATVFKAREPYTPGRMGAFDKTSYMLIRQFQFPYEYSESKDQHVGEDHDRLIQIDLNRIHKCFKKYTRGGFEEWVRKSDPRKILDFLKDALSADPQIQWTGFRIMGSVNWGNGHPIWTLELFAKHPETRTKVYNCESALNVESREPQETKLVKFWL